MDELLDEETARKIKERCMSGDWEGDHGTADNVLVQLLRTLGYAKTVEAYEAVGKWYA